MIPIHELLNKIKWDKRESPELITVKYLDRVNDKLIGIPYTNIERIEKTGGIRFMVLIRDDEVFIPLHRIREVLKNNTIIWKRQ